jgi:hypothetical protein
MRNRGSHDSCVVKKRGVLSNLVKVMVLSTLIQMGRGLSRLPPGMSLIKLFLAGNMSGLRLPARRGVKTHEKQRRRKTIAEQGTLFQDEGRRIISG